jgi:acyl carrier protein
VRDTLFKMFVESYHELFGDAAEAITLDSVLGDLQIESLDFIEISMRIEDEFSIVFESELFADVVTVGDAIAVFEGLIERSSVA